MSNFQKLKWFVNKSCFRDGIKYKRQYRIHSWYVHKCAYIHVFLFPSSAGLMPILYFLPAFGNRTMSVLRLTPRTLRFRGNIFTEPLPSTDTSIDRRVNNSSVAACILCRVNVIYRADTKKGKEGCILLSLCLVTTGGRYISTKRIVWFMNNSVEIDLGAMVLITSLTVIY
jgi:hypothetical protein